MEDVPPQFVFVLQADLAFFFFFFLNMRSLFLYKKKLIIYILHISVLLFLNVVINHTLVLTS